MIRKQLYIKDEHERALKVGAREMGISEAELVRRLLDGLLSGGGEAPVFGRAEAAMSFLAAADRISGSHRFPEDYRFDREELYGERGTRRE